MKKLLLLWGLMFLLCGCMDSQELKERSIIEAVGIDQEQGMYTLSFQLFQPAAQQGKESSGASEKSKLLQAQGRSISEAIDAVTHYNGNPIFLGNSTYIVLSADTAREGILQELHYFNGENEVSPSTMLVIADDSAAELLQAEAQNPAQGGSSIKDILEQGKKNGLLADSSMLDVLRRLVENSASPYLPLLSLEGEGEDSSIKLSGMAVFQGERMVDTLPMSQAKGILWADNKMKRALLVVEDESLGVLSAELQSSKTQVSVSIEQALPQFHLELDCSAQLKEIIGADRGGTLNQEQQKQAQRLLEQEIKRQTEEAITRCFTEGGCDLFRFGQHLKQAEPRYWKQIKQRWPELMADCPISVEVQCSMSKTGQQAME